MNIIIPIAGANKGGGESDYIKSLQEIERKTVLQYVFESLQSLQTSHFIVVLKKVDANKYHLDSIAKLLRPGTEIVIAENETMGAACTCMLAIDNLDMDEPLLITGGDQILLERPEKILADFQRRGLDGGVAIFNDIHPRWSYVRQDEQGRVIEAAEKRPISRDAVAGFYYYRKASFFFESAREMIRKNASVNGQFFICPTYNEMILKQRIIGTYPIKKEQYYNFSHSSGMKAYEAYLAEKRGRQSL